MRPLRTPPLPGGMREITLTTTNNQLLLRPSREVNRAILGVIAKAQMGLPQLRLHAFAFVSNHYHMLVSAETSETIARFAQFINCNITIKLNKINERSGTTWAHRYRGIDVSADEATQVWRLRYLLAHGVKENLVARVDDWPGCTSIPWLRDGVDLWGVWTNHTKKGDAQRRKSYVEVAGKFDSRVQVQLTVLPCWANMPTTAWRKCVRDIIAEIEREADDKREATGSRPLGAAAILAAAPHTRLPHKPRRPAPLAHAPLAELRQLRQRRATLHMLHRAASLEFSAGNWEARFPDGMFRPFGGFVEAPISALLSNEEGAYLAPPLESVAP